MTEQNRDDILSDFRADVSAPAKQEEKQESKPEDTWETKVTSLQQQLNDAQKTIGEQGRLLGEYRSLHAEERQEDQPHSSLSDEDFIQNPKDSTEALVEDRVSKIEQKYAKEMDMLKRDTAVADFQRRHPEAETLLRDQNFLDWANREHTYLANQAGQGDLSAAEALFSYWGRMKENESEDRDEQALRALNTERGSAAAGASPSGASDNARAISRERYREALAKGERIPPDVMKEIYEAYKSGNTI